MTYQTLRSRYETAADGHATYIIEETALLDSNELFTVPLNPPPTSAFLLASQERRKFRRDESCKQALTSPSILLPLEYLHLQF